MSYFTQIPKIIVKLVVLFLLSLSLIPLTAASPAPSAATRQPMATVLDDQYIYVPLAMRVKVLGPLQVVDHINSLDHYVSGITVYAEGYSYPLVYSNDDGYIGSNQVPTGSYPSQIRFRENLLGVLSMTISDRGIIQARKFTPDASIVGTQHSLSRDQIIIISMPNNASVGLFADGSNVTIGNIYLPPVTVLGTTTGLSCGTQWNSDTYHEIDCATSQGVKYGIPIREV